MTLTCKGCGERMQVPLTEKTTPESLALTLRGLLETHVCRCPRNPGRDEERAARVMIRASWNQANDCYEWIAGAGETAPEVPPRMWHCDCCPAGWREDTPGDVSAERCWNCKEGRMLSDCVVTRVMES